MRIGFIGLGHMGGPMSRNLLAAGHDLIVHDLRPDDTPRRAAAGREIVITSLPGPRQVEEVLIGQDGLLDGLETGAIWADMSTSVPAVADLVRHCAEPRRVSTSRYPTASEISTILATPA